MTFKSVFKAWINMTPAVAGRDAAIDRLRFEGVKFDIGEPRRTKAAASIYAVSPPT